MVELVMPTLPVFARKEVKKEVWNWKKIEATFVALNSNEIQTSLTVQYKYLIIENSIIIAVMST